MRAFTWLGRLWDRVAREWLAVARTAPRADVLQLATLLERARLRGLVRSDWIVDYFYRGSHGDESNRKSNRVWWSLRKRTRAVVSSILAVDGLDRQSTEAKRGRSEGDLAKLVARVPFMERDHVRALVSTIRTSGLARFGIPLVPLVMGESGDSDEDASEEVDALLAFGLSLRLSGDLGNWETLFEGFERFSGKFDVVSLDSKNGPASKSLMLVEYVLAAAADARSPRGYFRVCCVTPSNTESVVQIRTGFLFSVSGSACCVLFAGGVQELLRFTDAGHAEELSGLLESRDQAQRARLNVAPVQGGKFMTLTKARAGEDTLMLFEQGESGLTLSLAKAVLSETISDGFTVDDILGVRKIAIKDDGTPENGTAAGGDERNLIRRLKAYPVLNFSAETSRANL